MVEDNSPQMSLVGICQQHYVVFNGWKNGRRQEIYSTYNKLDAEAELESRLAGNPPTIKR